MTRNTMRSEIATTRSSEASVSTSAIRLTASIAEME